MEFRFAAPSGDERIRQLDLWYPTTEKEGRHDYRWQIGSAAEGAAPAAGPYPLVLFSHGYLGTSDQSIFLTEALARAGYVVAAMNHADSLGTRRLKRLDPPRFADGASWTDEKFRDRRDDLAALLDRVLEWNGGDGEWKGRIDAEAIGAMGHSLGGYTALGIAGGWKSWRDPRVKAAVLLSPYTQPYVRGGDLDGVTIPVMLQGGTLDFGVTPFLSPLYRRLGPPKVLLVLKEETHFGWTNFASLGKTTVEAVEKGNAELMVTYSRAFFDEHLLGSDESKLLEQANPRLESYRFQSK